MARKTLVIGLGTTGADICNRLMERLIWEHGSLQQTPWIRFLVVETAGTETNVGGDADNGGGDAANEANRALSLAEQTGNFLYVPVQQNQQIRDVLYHSDRWKSQLDPDAWIHSDIKTFLGNLRGPGAGNIRQFGRLATLFPAHYTRISDAVRQRLIALTALTSAQANADQGGSVNLPQGPVDLYIVGTLAGGTGSGCYIDVPYFLRFNPAFQPATMTLVGIMAAYPNNGGTNEYGSNTYHALREYHHFTTPGIDYRARFNGMDCVEPAMPYDEFHLIRPVNETRLEIDRMLSSAADYLYMRAFSPDAALVVNRRQADYAGGYSTPSPEGQQQHQATFGISGIEYPARRYVEICRLMLVQKTFEDWLAERDTDPPHYQDDFKRGVRKNLADRKLIDQAGKSPLLATSVATPGIIGAEGAQAGDLKQALFNLLEGRARGSGGDLTALAEARAQADLALGESVTVTPAQGLARDCIRQRISENRARIREEARSGVADDLVKTLSDLTFKLSGLHYAREYVIEAKRLIAEEATRLAEVNPNTGESNLQTRREALRNHLNQIEHELQSVQDDPFLGFLLGKTWAIPRLLAEWTEAAKDYYASWIELYEQGALLAIYRDLEADLERYGQRLSEQSYLAVYARTCLRAVEDEYRNQMSRPDSTNYETLDPVTPESLRREYDAAFSDPAAPENVEIRRKRELEKEQTVLGTLHPLFLTLFSPEAPTGGFTRSVPVAFDRDKMEIDPDEWDELLRRGRDQFAAIERRHILDLLLQVGAQDARLLIRSMIERSAPLLDIDKDDVTRFEDLPLKRAGFLFFNRQPQATASPVPREVQNFLTHLRAVPGSEDLHLHNTIEPHRITLVREQTAFPLSVVRGMIGEYGAYVRYAHNAPPRPTYYSRSDIAYWFPLEPVPEAEEIVTLFLALVGLGEIDTNDDPILFAAQNWDQPVILTHNLQHLQIQFSGDVQERNRVRVEMINRIHAFRNDPRYGDSELAMRLDRFVKSVQTYALLKSTGVHLDDKGAKSWLIPYLKRDAHLWNAWTQIPGNTPVAINPATLRRGVGTTLSSGFTIVEEGYYCNCGFRFGASEDDVKRIKRCKKCGELYVYD
jgi:hypothetical protein